MRYTYEELDRSEELIPSRLTVTLPTTMLVGERMRLMVPLISNPEVAKDASAPDCINAHRKQNSVKMTETDSILMLVPPGVEVGPH